MGVVHEWVNWCKNPNGLFDQYTDSNFRKLRIPILVISFSNDWRTPEKAVRALLNYFINASIKWYHLTVKEKGFEKTTGPCLFYRHYESTLWTQLGEWLKNDDFSFQSDEKKDIRIVYENTFQTNNTFGLDPQDEIRTT